ncbi:hypothetical protein TYRP_012010 [Tyrophagus putrescentiae]|nr:hypothetical protein TYRP_012010 [Tyrophagus putrescentiae]
MAFDEPYIGERIILNPERLAHLKAGGHLIVVDAAYSDLKLFQFSVHPLDACSRRENSVVVEHGSIAKVTPIVFGMVAGSSRSATVFG